MEAPIVAVVEEEESDDNVIDDEEEGGQWVTEENIHKHLSNGLVLPLIGAEEDDAADGEEAK